MDKITVFDTTIGSTNIGDNIIMDSVYDEIKRIFPKYFVSKVPTHFHLDSCAYNLIQKSRYRIVGGTNLLSSNMNSYNQWKINYKDYFKLENIILLGVGWWQYQDKPNHYTKILLKKILSKTALHSVRDSYTKSMLESIGIENVINTGCNTMFSLTNTKLGNIKNKKSEDCVFTLTDYNRNTKRDKYLINTLVKNYRTVIFWPQGSGDFDYFTRINTHLAIKTLKPALNEFDKILRGEIDYIGTRLHAGIRALQLGRRAIIIGIDNRSNELKNDFDLPVILERNLHTLESALHTMDTSQINIPYNNIDKWRNQFV